MCNFNYSMMAYRLETLGQVHSTSLHYRKERLSAPREGVLPTTFSLKVTLTSVCRLPVSAAICTDKQTGRVPTYLPMKLAREC